MTTPNDQLFNLIEGLKKEKAEALREQRVRQKRLEMVTQEHNALQDAVQRLQNQVEGIQQDIQEKETLLPEYKKQLEDLHAEVRGFVRLFGVMRLSWGSTLVLNGSLPMIEHIYYSFLAFLHLSTIFPQLVLHENLVVQEKERLAQATAPFEKQHAAWKQQLEIIQGIMFSEKVEARVECLDVALVDLVRRQTRQLAHERQHVQARVDATSRIRATYRRNYPDLE